MPNAFAAPAAGTLTALQIDRPTVVPVGLAPETVTVTGHLTSSVALDPACVDRDANGPTSDGPFIRLAPTVVARPVRAGMAPTSAMAPLRLVSGTATDGQWAATFEVPSAWSGAWEVTRVFACAAPVGAAEGARIDVDPRTIRQSATLTVTGSHVPVLSVGFRPNPVPWNVLSYTQTGRLLDSATGVGFAGVTLYGCYFACYIGPDDGATSVVTDANGFYAVALSKDGLRHPLSLLSSTPTNTPSPTAQVTTALTADVIPLEQPSITAHASVSRVRRGSMIAVSGTVYEQFGGSGMAVWLEVRNRNGHWSTLVATHSRAATGATHSPWSVRFPAPGGTVSYRAYLSAAPGNWWVAATSRPFIVVGL